ncbi:MAG TPA: TlpA disulfide reductase family protein [Gaiellaceae bacterium]|nr:TlpA disulfide reductase family protein [Gaiellaceae bacterium]
MTIVTWVFLGVLLLAVVLLGWLLAQVLRQQGRLLLRIEALERPAGALQTSEGDPARGGLPLATAFPPFRLPDLGGKDVGLEDFDTRVLLVHWSPECGFCREIAADLARLQDDLRRRKTELVLVSYGSPESNRALLEAHGLDCPALLQPDGRTIEGFARMGTPAAYLLDDRHRVAKPVAVGAREVPRLAEEAAGRRRLASERPLAESLIEREGLKTGVSAPAFELPDLAGRPVSLADKRGRRVLLVFSDPECGPCDMLLPDLARFEREHRENGLAVVMVGRGEPEENRRKAETFGVEFPVVLQPGWRLSKQYGIFATPVAFLIDEEGVIEREVARGPTAILELAREALSAEGRVPIS